MPENQPNRCPWPGKNPLMTRYHDEEWGVPLFDDKKLFEFILLDTFQAGLSWAIILNKRQGFRRAFDGFDVHKIAGYGEEKIGELLADPGIIRNKLKVRATVNNARCFIRIQDEFGSFSRYIWQFVNGEPVLNRREREGDIPNRSDESDAMSADLKKRGFKFVGTTTCYAFMQAAGLVNDHLTSCFRYDEIRRMWESHSH